MRWKSYKITNGWTFPVCSQSRNASDSASLHLLIHLADLKLLVRAKAASGRLHYRITPRDPERLEWLRPGSSSDPLKSFAAHVLHAVRPSETLRSIVQLCKVTGNLWKEGLIRPKQESQLLSGSLHRCPWTQLYSRYGSMLIDPAHKNPASSLNISSRCPGEHSSKGFPGLRAPAKRRACGVFLKLTFQPLQRGGREVCALPLPAVWLQVNSGARPASRSCQFSRFCWPSGSAAIRQCSC